MTFPDKKGLAAYQAASAKAIAKAKVDRAAKARAAQPTQILDKPAVLEEIVTEVEVSSTACPKCGADGTDPCLTKTGKKAQNTHKERA